MCIWCVLKVEKVNQHTHTHRYKINVGLLVGKTACCLLRVAWGKSLSLTIYATTSHPTLAANDDERNVFEHIYFLTSNTVGPIQIAVYKGALLLT